ncbi:MAG: exodeoxyribonuclease V subunit gamma [Deltaproteobacteria bacterium]|nr:exodeoxyribonuclease V subunit gamma [Deltaproteobacteria bacterium]
MLRLYYSNRTEQLLAALVEELEEERALPGASLFLRPQVVVPNRNVEAYLKLGIAQKVGISAGLEFHFLTGCVADVLRAQGTHVRLVDGATLRGMLLMHFHDASAMSHEELAPVQGYLLAAGAAPDALDIRRYQLATELSRLFEEYSYSRPDMLGAWRDGHLVLSGTPHAGVERWQRRLWLDLFGEGGAFPRRRENGETWALLHDLVDARAPLSLSKAPRRLHVFGFSYVASVFHRLMAQLATQRELRVYAPNPCEEYWEDVALAPRTPPCEDPFSLERADTPALRLWGRPGRENIRLLNSLADCDFEARFVDPCADGTSLLRQVQRDILYRHPDRADSDPLSLHDGSIRLLEAPGIRREVEIVASEIWRLLLESDAREETPSLRLNDIAVIVPSQAAERYIPHVAAVFDECHELPCHFVDLPLSRENRVVDAGLKLLALPLGTFTRRELLSVATHGLVARRFPGVDPREWITMCDRLGIFHGADRSDHAETYIQRDLYNWDQGMRRAALGVFMTGESSGDERAFSLGGERYFPDEQPLSAHENAGWLILLVRSLIADSRHARSARLTLSEWAHFLQSFLGAYLAPQDEEEQRALLRCQHALGQIGSHAFGEAKVSYRIAHELAKEALVGLSAESGHYLADGVVVSSLLPMRAVPFKVVFLLGMGEGLFPAPDHAHHLDLRAASRRPGDVSPRERDKYMFLETLLSTRDRLYLSHVAREPTTGEPLSASPVVLELMQILRGYTSREALQQEVVRHPLRRHDAGYFSGDGPLWSAHPEARREAQALALGNHLRAYLHEGRLPDRVRLEKEVRAPIWKRLEECLRIVSPPASQERVGPEGVVRIPVTVLRRFLECPLQGHARFWLRLEELEEDLGSLEDEPLMTDLGAGVGITRRIMVDSLIRGCDPLSLHAERAGTLELKGLVPTGIFGDAERAKHRSWLTAWSRQVSALGHGMAPSAHLECFGCADEHTTSGTVLPPICLEVDLPGGQGSTRRFAEIVGKTEVLVGEPDGSLLLGARRHGKDVDASVRNQRDVLRAFLDQVLRAAAGSHEGPHQAHLCFADEAQGAPVTVSLAPMSQKEAKGYLTNIVADLLGHPHAYLLPCEAVFLYWHHEGRMSLCECVEAAIERESSSSRFGPIPMAERFAPPPEDEARAIVARRFGPFLDRLGTTGK